MGIKLKIKTIIGKAYAKVYHYDSKYLSGRWFTAEQNYIGWNWVIKNGPNCHRRGTNLSCPWPASADSRIVGATNIEFHPDDLNNFQHFGCYFQGKGRITIGKGTWIAPNVGIITANHNAWDLDKHDDAKPVIIGEDCWIGMNSIILPGVELGCRTIVGAGAVVTKSFKEGFCIVAGNPAKLIKKMEIDNNAYNINS
ncbi:acyltransferase [Lactonifactor longoviformis]|uniref:Hexapeptide repeat of succinyl-transferase n=1 Tax=Lactonifactor longoviformis DSM 17459 TaxID=1122155 RepID=A0A1M4YNA2_9CLOT|nr:acyltransferase [Lactonifactor longoviformis]POP30946.1 acyltransferase [Lactonifactor longoviformis]SHF07117.1 Hexapeptide repeat of succinyl-transferase [Lactonifactor longoviformis DSM 17459]